MEKLKQLKKDLDLLTNKINKCKCNGLLRLYTESYDELSLLLEYYEYKIETLPKLYKIDSNACFNICDNFIKDIEFHKDISNKILDIFDNSDYTYYNLQKDNKINKKYMKELILDFYKSIDKNIYNFVLNEINDNILDIEIDNNLSGACYNIESISRSYLYLGKSYNKNDISFMLTLVHEIAHAIENKLLYSHGISNSYYPIYSEVISLFFEDLFLDYLKNNYIFEKERIFRINVTLEEDCAYYFDNINQICNLYDNNIEYAYLNIWKNIDEFIDSIKYGYGYLISKYFLYLYRRDKQYCMRKFYNFIYSQKIVEDVNLYNSLNIDNYKFIIDYIEENNKDIKKYIKK